MSFCRYPVMRTRHYIAIAFATIAVTGLLFAKAAHLPLFDCGD